MQDLLAKAEAWFEQQRREHLSVAVDYRPKGTLLPRSCRATLVIGRWEALDKAGQIVRMESRDFFIHVDELPSDPVKGDRIAIDEGGSEQIYEVGTPDGQRNAWAWADRSQKIRRIHTMAISGTSAIPNSTLLVRGIGVSPQAAITDGQIKSSLTLDLGQGLSLKKQLVANAAYVHVVLPVSFGDPTIRVNGFVSTAWGVTLRSIAFDGQTARPYRIYRSTYPVTGTVLVEVS